MWGVLEVNRRKGKPYGDPALHRCSKSRAVGFNWKPFGFTGNNRRNGHKSLSLGWERNLRPI